MFLARRKSRTIKPSLGLVNFIVGLLVVHQRRRLRELAPTKINDLTHRSWPKCTHKIDLVVYQQRNAVVDSQDSLRGEW